MVCPGRVVAVIVAFGGVAVVINNVVIGCRTPARSGCSVGGEFRIAECFTGYRRLAAGCGIRWFSVWEKAALKSDLRWVVGGTRHSLIEIES